MGAPAASVAAGASDAAAPADEQQQHHTSRAPADDALRGMRGPHAHAEHAAQDMCLTCMSDGRVHKPHIRRGNCKLAPPALRVTSPGEVIAAPTAQRSLNPEAVPLTSVGTQTLGDPTPPDLMTLVTAVQQLTKTVEELRLGGERRHDQCHKSGVSLQKQIEALNERLTDLELSVKPRGPDGNFLDLAASDAPPSPRRPHSLGGAIH